MRPLGAEIVTADSGEKALTLVLKSEFAIVLLDVQMPVMGGQAINCAGGGVPKAG